MIYLYYSDPKEKDLVEVWAKYGTKMGFTTLSDVLHSAIAINMSKKIIMTLIMIRHYISSNLI